MIFEGVIAFFIPGVMAGLLGVGFSDTITLGAVIVGIITGLAGLAVFGYGVRWKTAYEAEHAAATSLEDGRRAFQLRSERLEEEMKELRTKYEECMMIVGEQKAVIATYQAQPDLGQVVKAIESAVETSHAYSDANFQRLFTEHAKTREILARKIEQNGKEVHP